MTEKEIIEALKNNEKPFGLMSDELQAKAKEIGKWYFDFYGSRGWVGTLLAETPFRFQYVYRLRSDYQPEKIEAFREKITEKAKEKGYLINCYFEPTDTQDGPAFIETPDGYLIPHLAGYAIIPKQKLIEVKMSVTRAKKALGSLSDNHIADVKNMACVGKKGGRDYCNTCSWQECPERRK